MSRSSFQLSSRFCAWKNQEEDSSVFRLFSQVLTQQPLSFVWEENIMKFKISVQRPMPRPDIPRYDMWVPSHCHSTHALFSYFVCFLWVCLWVHTCHSEHIGVDGQCQMSVFTFYLVWGKVSLTILYTRLTGPWTCRHSPTSTSHIAQKSSGVTDMCLAFTCIPDFQTEVFTHALQVHYPALIFL